MRGDRPGLVDTCPVPPSFTPHARGSTVRVPGVYAAWEVYPACAGIDPETKNEQGEELCLPRMRGDRPVNHAIMESNNKFTPHARGSTAYPTDDVGSTLVYPACAGIDLDPELCGKKHPRLPRMRGDRPPQDRRVLCFDTFTPHARGSTWF